MMKYAWILCLPLLAACNPKLYGPEVTPPTEYRFAGDFSQDSLELPVEWWRLFGDPTLDALVDHALERNRNVAIALSRVMAARQRVAAARIPYLPSIDAELMASTGRTPPAGRVERYTVEPTLSWEISLFGAARFADREARAAYLSSVWAYKGARLTLVAEVATAYFTLLQYTRDLEIASRSYQLRRESTALIDSMYRFGMATGVALQQAQSLVYQAKADIPLYLRSIEQTRMALCVLLGEEPSFLDGVTFRSNLSDDYRPVEIPVGLPSQLLTRRPDVMEAAAAQAEAAARVGLARSARFPSIVLTGSGGVISASLKGIVSGDPWGWAVAGTIAQPIFAFGKLKRQERMARRAYQQSVLAYEQAALTAFAEVEDALLSVATYREQTDYYVQLVDANVEIARMTAELYRSGMTAYLDVIDAERNMYASQMEYVNLIAQQYLSYIDLFKALGGGW